MVIKKGTHNQLVWNDYKASEIEFTSFLVKRKFPKILKYVTVHNTLNLKQ